MNRALTFAAAAAAGVLLAVGTAAAQAVEGRVLETGTADPVVGAQVVLLDDRGEEHALVLTGEDGGFRIRAPGTGVYLLRVDRIGYRSMWSDPLTLTSTGVAGLEITVAVEAVDLTGISVAVEQRCRREGEGGPAVERVWQEARKSLAAARLTAGTPLRYRIERYTRRLAPSDLRVVAEERRHASGVYAGGPFASRPAAELQAEGYVVADSGGEFLYFGPDAAVLLSSTFLAAHCFRLVEDAERPGLIGLTFEPVRDRSLPDVSGTLWLDRNTARLRHLDFRYTRLPWSGIDADRFGGRVDFEHLPTGDLIVRRWRIRMPVVSERSALSSRSSSRGAELYVPEIREAGGVIEEVRDPAGRVLRAASSGLVAGTVTTHAGSPVAGARVWLEGTSRDALTGADGTYRIEGVPEGQYVVRFSHLSVPVPDSLLPARPVRVSAAGGAGRADLAIPAPGELAAALCPGEPQGGAVYGVVRDSIDREPLAGALVVLTWSRRYSVDRTTGSDVGAMTSTGSRDRPMTTDVAVTESWEAVRTTTGPDGSFRACGLPTDQVILARAWPDPSAAGEGGGTLTVIEIAGQRLPWVELRLAAGEPVRADLATRPIPR